MEKNIDFGYVADLYDYYATGSYDLNFYRNLCRNRENILELMCGTGRVSIPLIREGYPITCVDYSEEMLDIFRSKLGDESEHSRLICQDVCELEMDHQYDLIIIPSNSIAEILDKAKRQQAIQHIYRHLKPGGIFFCSLYNPFYRVKQADGTIKYLGKYNLDDGRTMVITYYNIYLSDLQIISGTQFFEIYDSNNRMIEKRCLDLRFSVITKEEICQMARAAGFSVKAVYGDYEPYHYDEKSTYMNFIFVKEIQRRRCRR